MRVGGAIRFSRPIASRISVKQRQHPDARHRRENNDKPTLVARATLEWIAVSKRSALRAKSSKNEQDSRLPQAEDEFDLTY